jgi:hypothetical protein
MEKSKIVEIHFGAMAIPPQLVIAIIHSELGFLQNFKTDWKQDLVRCILFITLKCKKYHLHIQKLHHLVLINLPLMSHQNSRCYYFDKFLMEF